MKTRYTIVILLTIFIVSNSSCVTQLPLDPDQLIAAEPDFENMTSFQRILITEPGTEPYEKARIDYLLERLSKSPYNFIRNDVTYTNTRAVMHLRWKYLRDKDRAATAEDFVDRVARGSKKTGQVYLMQIKPGRAYPLHEIFLHELNVLNQAVRHYQEGTAGRPEGLELQGVKQTASAVEIQSNTNP